MPRGAADIRPGAGRRRFRVAALSPIVVIAEYFGEKPCLLKGRAEVIFDEIHLLHGVHFHAGISLRRVMRLILHRPLLPSFSQNRTAKTGTMWEYYNIVIYFLQSIQLIFYNCAAVFF